MSRLSRLSSEEGFTLIEILVSITILSVSTLALSTMLARSTRQAASASAVIHRSAALTAETGRMSAMPFSLLAAGTTCVNVTAQPFPHTRCTTIADVSAKVKTVKVKVTPSGTLLVAADSAMFERSISGEANPPLGPI
jgi:prepilin-type N-terminal cleavage/methylation domain-containing protein